MLLRLARHLSKEKIPLHEKIGHYLRDERGLNSKIFRDEVLTEIYAHNELTENMMAVLELRYNYRNEQFFLADKLIDDLEKCAEKERLTIF